MVARKTKSRAGSAIIAAPDRQGVGCIKAALEARGVSLTGIAAPSRGWVSRLIDMLDGRPGLLIIAPSPSFGLDQQRAISEVLALGGSVLAWENGRVPLDPKAREQWLADRLAAQWGARTSPNLSAIALAAELYSALGDSSRLGAKVSGSPSSVKNRLCSEFLRRKIESGRDRSSPVVSVGEDGVISVALGRRKLARTPFPDVLAEAIGMLAERTVMDDLAGGPCQASGRDLALFLQPPARLLSESASKTLVRAFGMSTPKERLCQSATEAVRFAKTLPGKTVFKLVKPKLENKQSKGAVITDIEGEAAGRRAIHTLMSIGTSLGPPKPLGVLVAEQISGDVDIWLKIEDHRRLGRLVLAGPGNAPISEPTIALKTPVAADEAHRAVLDAGHCRDPETASKLAGGILCFAAMAHSLDKRIDRAEIHPMVVSKDRPGAVVLDALISIAE